MVSSAGIEPATTDFVDQSLDEPPGRGEETLGRRRKKEDSNPTPLPRCPLFSKQVWLHSQFFFRGSGQCGNRTRYAELFRLPLYQLSLPTKIILLAEEGRGLEPHTPEHDVRIAFQAISVASRICLPLELEGPFFSSWPRTRMLSLRHSVRPRAATRSTAATDPGGLPHRGEPAASPGETWA